MSKILYVVLNNENKDFKYNINEDTIIYHFSINSSSTVDINLCSEDVTLYYYYSTINYDNNSFKLNVNHLASNTHSEVFNHGVNVKDNILDFDINGTIPKTSAKCICNQDNQVINLVNGKSTIKPNLFIDNYDVDSSHSAYIGKFRDEIIFYMMSRGISRSNCYLLLLKSFLINSDSIDLNRINDFILEIDKI